MVLGHPTAVRAVYDVFRFPDLDAPYNIGRMKTFYPATLDSQGRQESDSLGALHPVVIFLAGGLVEMNRYQWLAERLVEHAGVVCVCTDAVVPLNDIAFLLPLCGGATDNPSTKALETVIAKLHDLNKNSKLAGMMDLNRIILGGHSFGGRIAMEYASEEIAEIAAVFSYGAHIAQPGNGSQEIFPREVISKPTLLLAGSRDGVIENYSFRYGVKWTDAAEPVRRTFEESLKQKDSDIYIEFDGFNHFAMVDPIDQTIGSSGVDYTLTVNKQTALEELGHVITLFVQEHAHRNETAAKELKSYLQGNNALIKEFIMGA